MRKGSGAGEEEEQGEREEERAGESYKWDGEVEWKGKKI